MKFFSVVDFNGDGRAAITSTMGQGRGDAKMMVGQPGEGGGHHPFRVGTDARP